MARQIASLNHKLSLKDEQISYLKNKNAFLGAGLKKKSILRRIHRYYKNQNQILRAKYKILRKTTVMDLVRANKDISNNVKTFVGLMFRKRYVIIFNNLLLFYN